MTNVQTHMAGNCKHTTCSKQWPSGLVSERLDNHTGQSNWLRYTPKQLPVSNPNRKWLHSTSSNKKTRFFHL